jgi:hypothetical protein
VFPLAASFSMWSGCQDVIKRLFERANTEHLLFPVFSAR